MNSDGTYDILYDDGEREKRVKADLIKGGEDGGGGGGGSGGGGGLQEGSKVEARFMGGV